MDKMPKSARLQSLTQRLALGLVSSLLVSAMLPGCQKPTDKTPDNQTVSSTRPEADHTPPALPVQPSTAAWSFQECAADSGISFTYRNGQEAGFRTIVESIGGGVASADWDRNGLPDLYLVGGGSFAPNRTMQGRAGGLFWQQSPWQFTQATAVCGVQTAGPFTFGTAVADYDEDGFDDLLVTGLEYCQLWRNQGDGTFLPIEPGVRRLAQNFVTSAAWLDADADGDLDVYLARYVDWSWSNHPACLGRNQSPDVCPPRQFQGLDDQLLLSDGAGGFTDATASAGLVANGKGLGVLAADTDLDGDTDLYVANDTTPNFLYQNNGRGGLDEVALLMGVALDDRAVPNGSMGVDVCDYNLDGTPDLWVANYEQEPLALYRQTPGQGYQYASHEAGVSSIGQLFVAFGTAWGDLDHDGDEDVVVTNGHVVQTAQITPIDQEPVLLENRAGELFRVRYPSDQYLGRAHLGRGLLLHDLDTDGDLDLVITHNNAPVALLQNQLMTHDQSVQVELIGREGVRSCVGAVAWLEAERSTQLRLAKGGGSYLSSRPAGCLHWGVVGATALLKVQWRTGVISQHRLAGPGRWVVREGAIGSVRVGVRGQLTLSTAKLSDPLK